MQAAAASPENPLRRLLDVLLSTPRHVRRFVGAALSLPVNERLPPHCKPVKTTVVQLCLLESRSRDDIAVSDGHLDNGDARPAACRRGGVCPLG